ncbi:MAG: hypothetical protein P8Y20_03560 [Gammaproteobacteria bacterium]|jgi:hypothetical protein
MKADEDQEKALREKIKNLGSDNNKSELRPIEKYSIYEELKNKNRQEKMTGLNGQLKYMIVAILVVFIVLGYYLI